jgi:acetyl esterase/lipase
MVIGMWKLRWGWPVILLALFWGPAAWVTGEVTGPVVFARRVVRHIPPGVRVEQDLVYATPAEPAHRLDLYRPVHPSSERLPVILHLHPGGWHQGDKASHREIWCWLASRGYLVASANYRLSGEAPWPAPIQDAKAAVRWLRANAARYGGDPDRIGGLGESAGGQLVALLATTGDDRWNDAGGNPGVSARLQAVVAQYAPMDLAAFSPDCRPLRIDLQELFHAPYDQPPAAYADASPVTHARGAAVPFLLIHGRQDCLVPIDQSERMLRALRQAGKAVELIRVENADHNLTPIARRLMKPSQAQVNQAIADYFARTLAH